MYTGSSISPGLIWFSQIPTAATASPSAIKWLTSEERKIETGTISAGNTVLVIRLACSSRLDADRCTVSLKQQPRQHAGEKKQRVVVGHLAGRHLSASGRR